jgi:intracellular multiplication protein IcmE
MAPMMQGSPVARVFSGAGGAGPRRLALIGGTAVVLLAAVGLVVMRGHHQAENSAVAKLPDVNAEPGGMHSNPYYNQLATQQAQQQAKTAAASGQSSVAPMAPGMQSQPVVAKPVAQPEPPHPIVRPVPPAHLDPAPVAYVPPATAQQTPSQSSPEKKQQNQLYAAAIGSMMSGWGNGPAPVTQVYIDPSKNGWSGGAGSGSQAVSAVPQTQLAAAVTGGRAANGQPAPVVPPATILIPAGKGVYARSKLAADSDTGGPVVVTAESGPIAGDDMTGDFSRRGDRLVITLNSITLQDGEQKSIDALVIAPDSMETAVASSVDQHYVARFVLPVAAAFVAGLGQAIQQSNATVAVSPLGGYTAQNHLNFNQQLGVAAGAAGSQLQNLFIQAAPNGPTVKLAAGANVGVVFLKPLTDNPAP